MAIPLRCRCGKLQGEVDTARVVARALCYCKDCQAFARFLKAENEVLDAAGGTEVMATLPAAVRFTAGQEHLACMSLSPQGIYRWYASCCDTPIGNTPRNPKVPYAGMVRICFDAPPETLDRHLGRTRFTANTASARAPVKATPLGLLLAFGKISGMMLGARVSGRYRDNPFFEPGTDMPVRQPRVLTQDERAAVTP